LLLEKLHKKIIARKAACLYRERRICAETLVNFSSNDYLGLRNDPAIKKAVITYIEKYGLGSGASKLISGFHNIHQDLELEFAEFIGCEKTIIFSSGYMANLGVITALTDREDIIFQDKLSHASLIDAAILSRAKLIRFTHLSSQDLSNKLQLNHATIANKLIVTESIFSMEGSLAPIDEYLNLASQNHAGLLIDEAHSIGVLGKHGRGAIEHYNIDLTTNNKVILVYPLGKAFGMQGGIVAGSNVLVDSIIQYARTYMYTTGISPAITAGIKASLKIIKTEHWRREKLAELIFFFIETAQRLELPSLASTSQIQSILIKCPKRALLISEKLRQAGFFVIAIREPTVPNGSDRLRISLTINHSKPLIKQLLTTIKQEVKTHAL
jgi:8-amino-7-oxononanoate synthase